MAGVECDRVPPPRASPVESAASTERERLFPSLSLLSLTLHPSIPPLLPSFHLSRSLSLRLPPPHLQPAAAASRSVGWLAGVVAEGTAGVVVAWTEINIRRASTYSCPLARAQPASLMFASLRIRVLLAPSLQLGPRFLVRRTEGTPSSYLCSALFYLGLPPIVLHIPLSHTTLPRGWTNTRTRAPHTCERTRRRRGRRASARVLANQPFLYRVCFDV